MADSKNSKVSTMPTQQTSQNQNSTSSHSAVLAITQLLTIDSKDGHQTKAWHSENHFQQRTMVQGWISDLVSQRRSHAEPNWTKSLPEVVKQIETRLYSNSESLEE